MDEVRGLPACSEQTEQGAIAFVLGLLTRILKTDHNDVASVAHLPLPSVGPPVVDDGDLKNQSAILLGHLANMFLQSAGTDPLPETEPPARHTVTGRWPR